MKQAVRFVLILGIICLVMGSGVAMIYAHFKDTLAARDEAQRSALRLQVLPGGQGYAAPEPVPGAADVFVVKRDDGTPAAYAAEGAAQGYSSTVRVMVGMAADEHLTLRKVVVLSQQETPGLGAKIEKPDTFSKQFIGKSATSPIGVAKGKPAGNQVQAITGATVSSEAVASIMNKAMAAFRADLPAEARQ